MWAKALALGCVASLLAVLPARAPSAEAASPVCDVRDPAPVALRQTGLTRFTEEPGAGRWKTWQVALGDVAVPPPPAMGSAQYAVELADVHAVQMTRTPEQVQAAQRWGSGAAVGPWTEVLLGMIERNSTSPDLNPPRIARLIAIFETAMSDAMVVTWNAKYCHQRPTPSMVSPLVDPVVDVPPAPSYPSEHAAAAGVAAALLPAFFPDEAVAEVEAMAWEAALSRVWAGAAYRSDIDAGLTLGKAVARTALQARADDGWDAVWDGSGRIEGKCNWKPTPPAFRSDPLEPLWGSVRPFVMSSGDEFRPPPPPACDGDEYEAAAYDVYAASQDLTDRQKEIAEYWAGDPGSETPPGMNLRIGLEAAERHELNTMRQARLLAHLGAAIADAGIAAWDAKFHYWSDRPVTTIRRMWDPEWTSYIGTPPFPGYVSGHSTFSGATAELLSLWFPGDRAMHRALATDAAMSRFFGGIHPRYDNEVGLEVGQQVGRRAFERAAADGAG